MPVAAISEIESLKATNTSCIARNHWSSYDPVGFADIQKNHQARQQFIQQKNENEMVLKVPPPLFL